VGYRITVKAEGVKKLLSRDLIEGLSKELDAITFANALDIETKAKMKAPVNDGYLKSSIHTTRISNSNYEVGSPLHYAPYVEFGTGDRVKVPDDFIELANKARRQPSKGNRKDFMRSLARWAEKKGVGEFLWQIYWSIIHNGIYPHPYLYPAFFEKKFSFIDEVKNTIDKYLRKHDLTG
jgi:hypothetical protein